MAPDRRRWIVDSIEEGIAALEEDGERLVHVPAWILPKETREGTTLLVERERTAKGASAVRITIDDEAKRISKERPDRGGDSGGDIRL